MRSSHPRTRKMIVQSNRALASFVGAALVALVVARPAFSDINLEWRPMQQTVPLGADIEIGLYAVSDSGADQTFNSAQAIIIWDPTVLQLTGTDLTGSIGLSTSAFLAGNSYGLNEVNPPADGNGLWIGTAPLGEVRQAHPEGSLLTYITFSALAEIGGTPVALEYSFTVPGHPTAYSKVMSGTHDVLGTLGGPAVVGVLGLCGDLNCDGQVNVFDIDPFVLALVSPDEYATTYPGCDVMRADVNCDGAANTFDIDPFVICLVAGGGPDCD